VGERLELSNEEGEYFQGEQQLRPSRISIETPDEKYQPKVRIHTTQCEDGSWKLVFVFPDPVEYREEVQGDSLYFVFNQGVDSKDSTDAANQLTYLLKRYASGLNSLQLITKKNLFYRADAIDNIFTLILYPNYCAPLEAPRRLKIARARFFVEERFYHPALCALCHLAAEYPDDKDVMILRATLEGLLPRWQKQVKILQRLRCLYPCDDEIRRFYYDAWCPHRPFLRVERQLQRTIELAAVQVARVQGEEILDRTPCHTLYGGIEYQNWSGHIGSITDSQGNIVGFKGRRNQESLYLRNEWESGTYLSGFFYAQDGSAGVGAEAGGLIPYLQGNFWVTADWHKPSWGVFEALAFAGREDKLRADMGAVYNRFLAYGLGGGIRRVGILGVPTGFATVMANAEVFFNLTIGNPIFALNYGLDAEYVIHKAVKIGIDGIPFNPLSYTSYENHSFRLYLYYQWRDHLFFTLFAGKTYNRLGINDLTLGATMKYLKQCPCGWDLEFSFIRYPSTNVQGATSEYYTGTFTYRF
jgi:hypothetical protein